MSDKLRLDIPGVRLVIPNGTTRIIVKIRHSDPDRTSGKENDVNHPLSEDGIQLCNDKREFWESVRIFLESSFGRASFSSSKFIRTRQTIQELFSPEGIWENSALNLAPNFYQSSVGQEMGAERKQGIPDPEIVRRMLARTILMSPPPFSNTIESYRQFVRECRDTLTFAGVHEPHLSQLAQPFLPEEQLGMDFLEGVVFFLNTDGIISATKLSPLSMAS
ncbi:MAG: hypothetical protein V1853_00080 [bacterium]